jgi:ABC-type transport system involved in cytochrome c biogenesis permease subunit
VCVGAIASVMYLVQSHRLRRKSPGTGGLRLLSLERLETMNRRAISAAFPLLTVGLLVGAALGYQRLGTTGPWLTPKVLGTVGLWLANAVLLILRYSWHARGRWLAFGTLGAFAILLIALATVHPFVGGGES